VSDMPSVDSVEWLGWHLRTEMRVALTRRGWTQKRLAQETGLSEKHVAQMLTGAVQGKLTTWGAMFTAAGCRVRLDVTQRPEGGDD
jgi:predicted transcriptional regulator